MSAPTLNEVLQVVREAVPDPQAHTQIVQAVVAFAASLGVQQDATPTIVGLTLFETH